MVGLTEANFRALGLVQCMVVFSCAGWAGR